jgi:hypothetical protein
VKSLEDLARVVGIRLDQQLASAGFKEWKPNSKRFRLDAEGDTIVEFMTVVSRTLPSTDWKVDIGIELISHTINGWLCAHSKDFAGDHRAASSKLSKLRTSNINLIDFVQEDRLETNVSDLIATLRTTTLTPLLPKVRTFPGFVETVGTSDDIWKLTFEARLAINAIQGGLEDALTRARAQLSNLRDRGYPQRVTDHYQAFLHNIH